MKENIKKIYKIILYMSIYTIFIPIIFVLVDKNSNIVKFFSTKTAEMGTLFLTYMLVIKSIYLIINKYNKKNEKLKKTLQILRINNTFQREQGLIVFNLFFVHSYIEIIKYWGTNREIYNILTIIIPTIIFIYMTITSFRYFQKKDLNWKKRHTVVWVVMPMILIHVILVSHISLKYYLVNIVLIIVSVLEYIYLYERGKKHLKFILYGIIISILQLIALTKYQDFLINSISNKNSETSVNNIGNNNANDSSIIEEDESINDDSSSSSEDNNTINNTDNSDEETSSDTESSSETNNNQKYNDGTYTGSSMGFRGSIDVSVTFQDDQITDVEVVSINDDPQFYMPAVQTLPQEILNNQGTDNVQAISGSTFSSNGIINATNNAIAEAQIN